MKSFLPLHSFVTVQAAHGQSFTVGAKYVAAGPATMESIEVRQYWPDSTLHVP